MRIIICILFIMVLHTIGYADGVPSFDMHTIIPALFTPSNNSWPHDVKLVDINDDSYIDMVVSHVSWGDPFIHPYVAWFSGPLFKNEYIIIDKQTYGTNCKILHFVIFDVDGDGKEDLIGQGYQPYHNGNKWYRCPDDPRKPWTEYYDYGTDLKNGHDILLWDIDDNSQMDIVLMDSHNGKIIVKPIPKGEKAKQKWPYYTIVDGIGFTHYMSLFDLNGDGYKDIVVGKEEDGGEGIWWFQHPGFKNVRKRWKKHFVIDANFTKVFARDLDADGDVDFVGTGEFFTFGKKDNLFKKMVRKIFKMGIGRSRKMPTEKKVCNVIMNFKRKLKYSSNKLFFNQDFGWYENTGNDMYRFHEFDKKDNNNDVIGGHNCELVDVDQDGDEDLIVGGVDVKDMKQRFRWYEYVNQNGDIRWIEHPLGITSAEGWDPQHGYYCGEMTYGDVDNDGDLDLVYSGQGSGFLGWFENLGKE